MEVNSAKLHTGGKVDLARPDEHETERKWEFNKNQLLLVPVKLHGSYPLLLTTTLNRFPTPSSLVYGIAKAMFLTSEGCDPPLRKNIHTERPDI